MSNNKFSDIILISSDNVKIPSHRCVLSKYSKFISKIIEEFSDLYVGIDIENFNAETINAVLSFLYDKNDAINGKEIDVFKFALEYGIQELMDVCCTFFEKSVSSENVCEYIQIAYSNNFEELKQKCLKVLVEKKKEIDALELAVLPKNIIIDAFCL
uniref:BTB domain-containing protein n=1 Tax=Panagrolaimus davidi TaxID=227884 RepID=A0A914PRC1_9BILA